MVVKVTKSAVVVDETLDRLDHGTIPYEKMPVGSVIQTQWSVIHNQGAVNEAETNSSSYQPTLFEVRISPKFSNSLMVITAAPNIKSNGGSAYHTLAVYKKIGNVLADFIPVVANGNTSVIHGITNWRFNGESLWYAQANIFQVDVPGSTEEIIYKIYHRVSVNGAYTVRTGENSSDEYMMVQEIKQ